MLHLLNTVGDAFVAQWLNGEHPDLVNQSPELFRNTVRGAITIEVSVRRGISILTTHFEIVKLVHAHYVARQELSKIDEDWMPTKMGGVLIWRIDDQVCACDYESDLSVVGSIMELDESYV